MSNKLVMLTCYDATFARILTDTRSVDYILVGDSLGMVIGGEKSTLKVTMEDIVYHTSAVKRGIENSEVIEKPVLIADMPIDSYRSPEEALKNARRLLEAGAQMIKLEGAALEQVECLKANHIRVCGHIGLTPQSIQDFKVQGKRPEEANRLSTEARALTNAGVEILVLEMLPAGLALQITTEIRIPTIGIGAGVGCSGQVLVLYDLLGFNPDFHPKFLKTYATGYQVVREAIETYSREVRESRYPDDPHSFH